MKPTDEYQDHPLSQQPPNPYDLVQRLRKRAEIRRQISTRKSVQNNEPDRIADLLEEAANEIEALKKEAALQRLSDFTQMYDAKKHGAEE